MLKLHPLFLVCFCFPKKRKMKKKMLQLHLQQILLRTTNFTTYNLRVSQN